MDPVTLTLVVGATLGAVALAARLIPAIRAIRIEPAWALRGDSTSLDDRAHDGSVPTIRITNLERTRRLPPPRAAAQLERRSTPLPAVSSAAPARTCVHRHL